MNRIGALSGGGLADVTSPLPNGNQFVKTSGCGQATDGGVEFGFGRAQL